MSLFLEAETITGIYAALTMPEHPFL